MSFNHYYQTELFALRELGREFAERNPSLAPFFNTPGRDPDVERILEGFAFLTGRLRQKLDDELPEITHALFNLLWPNYLRQVPSCSILQFKPSDSLSASFMIPRGVTATSQPVDGISCTYATCYDTEILPIGLEKQKIVMRDGEKILVLGFKSLGPPLETIPFSKIRLFLAGEKTIASTLFFYLTYKVKSLRIVLPKEDSRGWNTIADLGAGRVKPVGFAKDEALFPYPSNSFPGYRFLQEYFCFPDKFLFVDVEGLEAGLNKERLSAFTNKERFELHFVLEDLPDNFESFTKDHFQLYCTPVVNIFPRSATPLTLDHRQTEYRIVPDPRFPYHYSVYSVENVESSGENTKERREYVHFESFDHVATQDDDADISYYCLRVKPSIKDESMETYISIVQDKDGKVPAKNETLSMELFCTNRLLPLKLGVGDICLALSGAPESIKFSNITPVTPPYLPPLEKNLLWRLISNMSLNYIPLTNVKALRGLLATYDFKAVHDARRARVLRQTLNGLVHVGCEEADRIYRGLPLRGTLTKLRMSKAAFTCEGDMYLFASVLNEFFALYATINSFHQLILTEDKTGEQYQWPARLGNQSL